LIPNFFSPSTLLPRPPSSTLFPYTTLFRSHAVPLAEAPGRITAGAEHRPQVGPPDVTSRDDPEPGRLPARHHPLTVATRRPTVSDRKSTRLNSSHLGTSYAVFCLTKKNRAQ